MQKASHKNTDNRKNDFENRPIYLWQLFQVEEVSMPK